MGTFSRYHKEKAAEQAYADAMSDVELYDLLHEKNHHFDLANAILQIKRNREAYLQHERFDFLVEAIDRMEECGVLVWYWICA